MARQAGRDPGTRLEVVWRRFLALPAIQSAEFMARVATLHSA
jgi:hypothetical protein